jgi:hypothetical protein
MILSACSYEAGSSTTAAPTSFLVVNFSLIFLAYYSEAGASKLLQLPRNKSRRPSRLKIIATRDSIQIHHLASEI